MEYEPEVKDLLDILDQGRELLKKSVAYVKEAGIEYMDLYGRKLVDIALDLILGYLFYDQASTKVDMQVAVAGNGDQTISMKKRKEALARRFITKNAPKIAAFTEAICSGDTSSFSQYEALIGPVPEEL